MYRTSAVILAICLASCSSTETQKEKDPVPFSKFGIVGTDSEGNVLSDEELTERVGVAKAKVNTLSMAGIQNERDMRRLKDFAQRASYSKITKDELYGFISNLAAFKIDDKQYWIWISESRVVTQDENGYFLSDETFKSKNG